MKIRYCIDCGERLVDDVKGRFRCHECYVEMKEVPMKYRQEWLEKKRLKLEVKYTHRKSKELYKCGKTRLSNSIRRSIGLGHFDNIESLYEELERDSEKFIEKYNGFGYKSVEYLIKNKNYIINCLGRKK